MKSRKEWRRKEVYRLSISSYNMVVGGREKLWPLQQENQRILREQNFPSRMTDGRSPLSRGLKPTQVARLTEPPVSIELSETLPWMATTSKESDHYSKNLNLFLFEALSEFELKKSCLPSKKLKNSSWNLKPRRPPPPDSNGTEPNLVHSELWRYRLSRRVFGSDSPIVSILSRVFCSESISFRVTLSDVSSCWSVCNRGEFPDLEASA